MAVILTWYKAMINTYSIVLPKVSIYHYIRQPFTAYGFARFEFKGGIPVCSSDVHTVFAAGRIKRTAVHHV